MKSLLILLGAVLAFLIFVHGEVLAQEKYIPGVHEELYGTWTNEKMFPPKWVMRSDGIYEQCNSIAKTVPFERGEFEIWKKWTDSEGNIWYDAACTVVSGVHPGFMFQATWKISESGNVAEWVRRHVSRFDQSYFVSTIDSKDLSYRFYRRSAD